MPSVPFLGCCEVCERPLRTYRSLSNHLRHNTDAAHQDLKRRWHAWRDEYRATLRCRKCGELFTITDKAQRDRKRCDRCEGRRASMSKRAYEALTFDKPPDPRQVMTSKGTKAQWDGLEERVIGWAPGDDTYRAVVRDREAGVGVRKTMERLGITYRVYRGICGHRWGAEYDEQVYERRARVGSQNLSIAHRKYEAMTPEEKAELMKRRFGGTCALENKFSGMLRRAGYAGLEMNRWQSLPIDGQKVPREADIKVAVGDGRKVVVLCDGEAFHGPDAIHGDPQERIDGDRATALAFFGLGYSVVRYSETEIHDGMALDHFTGVMRRLESCEKIYRNWCPPEERVV